MKERISSFINSASLLDSYNVKNTAFTYKVPIGIDMNGQVFIKDFADVSHLLITGFSGAGKTSFIQTVLSCLVETHGPAHMKIGVFDSTKGAYNAFAGLPHLITPITEDYKKASEMLQWVSNELKRRLSQFEEAGTKNFAEYITAQRDVRKPVFSQIFIVIDDYYVLQDYQEVTDALIDLTNRGSEAGIHCIIVTSVSSSKTLIKDIAPNIPFRINFCVISRSTSKFSVSHIGADNLYSPGEILYHSPKELGKYQVFNIPNASIQTRNQEIALETRDSLYILSDKAVDRFGQEIGKQSSNTVATMRDKELLASTVEADRFTELRNDIPSKEAKTQIESRHEESVPNLRSFDLFTINGGNISVYNNKIHLSFNVVTRFGPGITKVEVTGDAIMAIILKRPGLLFPGYLKFIFKSGAELDNENPDLLKVNASNVSKITKLKVARNDEHITSLFLAQLSEDIGVPVTVV